MSSADVWRQVADRQQQHGNSIGRRGNVWGRECLLGSVDRSTSSGAARRAAARDFEKVVGMRPDVFNDQVSSGGKETRQVAAQVAAALDGGSDRRGQLTSSGRPWEPSTPTRALPAATPGWLDAGWWTRQAQPEMEASR